MNGVANNRISVIIITLNEEKNIKRCLDSVVPVADEIIVIDSFSSDRTREICDEYGVQFVQNKWPGINAQRNFSLNFSKYDYVLSLDADEALSDDLCSELKRLKSDGFTSDGYVFNRMTNYCGKWIRHSGWYPDSKLRLFNKKRGSYQGTDPHDEVIMNEGCAVRAVKKDILHFSYYSIEEHLDQINKFTTVSAREKMNKGKSMNTLVHLIFYPVWTFMNTFIIKLGFLDGYYGFVLSALDGYYRFLKYLKLKHLMRSQ